MKGITRGLLGGTIIIFTLAIAFHANYIHLPISQNTDAIWGVDFSDNRILVGSSHNVFAAKIVKKTGQRMIDGFPVSTYSVQIISNIKGELKENVSIDQVGGYENGILQLFENGPLLKPGSTYILATRTQSDGTYFLQAYLAGNVKISDNSSLNTSELISLVQNNQKYIDFTEAYKNQIIPE